MPLVKIELIGLEPIQDLVELVLWTTYIKYAKPGSLLIIAEPESGKTELMKKYRKNKGVQARRRFTAYGVQDDLINDRISVRFLNPKILGHVLVYDFSSLFSFKPSTVDSTMSFLDALTEEGISSESTYVTDSDKLKKYEGLKGGIIAGINTYGFFSNPEKKKIRANILKGGFFSRNIVASYRISETMLAKIFDSVKQEEYREDKKFVNLIPLNFPKKRVDVKISLEFKETIKDIVKEIRETINEDFKTELKGIRLFKQLIALAKASALRDGRIKVISKDVDRLRYLSHWMNLKQRNLKDNYPFSGDDVA